MNGALLVKAERDVIPGSCRVLKAELECDLCGAVTRLAHAPVNIRGIFCRKCCPCTRVGRERFERHFSTEVDYRRAPE